MRSRPAILQQLALNVWSTGASLTATARICSLPVGTVKAWRSRGKWARSEAHETTSCVGRQTGHETGRSKMRLACFRGVTAVDLPGKDRVEQSMNFFALKRGTYPPRSAGIPGTLEGHKLLRAIRAWCKKKGVRRQKPSHDYTAD